MSKVKAYSAASAKSPLAFTNIPRRNPTEHDVQIEILFCGICHSDLHSVRSDWSEVVDWDDTASRFHHSVKSLSNRRSVAQG